MKTLFTWAVTAWAVVAAPAEMTANPTEMLTVRVGETLTAELNGNPTTGYSWTLSEPLRAGAPIFVSIGLKNQSCPEDAENPCCGAPRPTEVRITGVHPGAASFTMQYSRVWEGDVPPLKTRTFVVTVQE